MTLNTNTPPHNATDINSYLSTIFKLTEPTNKVRCYRGQSNSNWKLKPSVMRNLRANAEDRILSELLVEAPNEFGGDKSMFDKLVRAQHYSLPTRLLDVTLNPLVALYFSCNEKEQIKEDGKVRIFDFNSPRIKFADSDTVSLICNLSRLSDKERNSIKTTYKELNKTKAWNIKKTNQFRELEEIKRLIQFVRVEKSYFLNAINPKDLFKYLFVFPSKNNRRVIAQSGAFIAAGLLDYNAPENSAGFSVKNITIPADAKDKILKQLDTLNINSRTMFPEIEFTSKYIKGKWSN